MHRMHRMRRVYRADFHKLPSTQVLSYTKTIKNTSKTVKFTSRSPFFLKVMGTDRLRRLFWVYLVTTIFELNLQKNRLYY